MRVCFEIPDGWDPRELASTLEGAASIAAPAQRLGWLVRRALSWATPFEDESSLGHAEDGLLRIRLRTMDCATFVYYLVAMAFSATEQELARAIARVRYQGGQVAEQNLLHYTINVLSAFVECGWLQNATTWLLPDAKLPQRRVRLGVLASGARFVRQGGDSNLGTAVSAAYVPTEWVHRAEDSICDGDVVALVSARDPDSFPAIVGHLGFAFRAETAPQSLLLAHCSKSRVGTRAGPRAGISLSMPWDEEAGALVPSRGWRTLRTYLEDNPSLFAGVMVYRAPAQAG